VRFAVQISEFFIDFKPGLLTPDEKAKAKVGQRLALRTRSCFEKRFHACMTYPSAEGRLV
jgi:hypothetical protein